MPDHASHLLLHSLQCSIQQHVKKMENEIQIGILRKYLYKYAINRPLNQVFRCLMPQAQQGQGRYRRQYEPWCDGRQGWV
jgi:hypothetical protein